MQTADFELPGALFYLHSYGLSGLLPIKNCASLELRLQGVLPDGGSDRLALTADDDIRVSTCVATSAALSTRFSYRELRLQIRSPVRLFSTHSPPVLSWFCSPSAPCTYTWVTTCGYPRKELQHLTFGLSCISSLLEEGQLLDSTEIGVGTHITGKLVKH